MFGFFGGAWSLIPKIMDIGHNRDLDKKFRLIATGRRVVSALYKLLSLSSQDRLYLIKHQWEKGCGVSMTTAQWESVLKNSLIQMRAI